MSAPPDPTTPADPPAPRPPLQSLLYDGRSLRFLNQRLLPSELRYQTVLDADGAAAAVGAMEVRGAPAIALLGCLAVALELKSGRGPRGDPEALLGFVMERMERIRSARPTAVNVGREMERLRKEMEAWMEAEPGGGEGELRARAIAHLEALLREDVAVNRSIGGHGARHIAQRLPAGCRATVLSHCNTGSLATAGYGTALGVVRALHSEGRLERLLCTETRPFLQGARLTALEMLHDGVPTTLIADSAAAAAIRERGVNAVVVGADRVAANGDTANKIGTYSLAVAALHHGIPFYVAAPSSSWDPDVPSGGFIPIEERPESELTELQGVRLAPPGVDVWNPAFDVTPHELITGGIVTEFGVFRPEELRQALEGRPSSPYFRLAASRRALRLLLIHLITSASALPNRKCLRAFCALAFYFRFRLAKPEVLSWRKGGRKRRRRNRGERQRKGGGGRGRGKEAGSSPPRSCASSNSRS